MTLTPQAPATWKCGTCGREVPWGLGHVCPKGQTSPETNTRRIADALERIADALETITRPPP